MQSFLRTRAFALTIAAAACVTVGLIWLPVGHAMIGLIEEWDMVSLFHDKGVFFVTSAHSPMPFLQIRPLNIAPMALAYVLGPNSFLTWHFLLALSLVGKAVGMTVVARWLLHDRWIALGTGLLFVLYPADTMQMTLRAVHIDCSVALDIIALGLFLTATDTEPRAARWALTVAAAACFLIGSLIYETNLFLAPAPFLLWWARRGSFAELMRRPVPILAWCLSVALNVAYIAFVSRQGGLYQQGFLHQSTPLPALLAQRGPLLFTNGMYREFIDSWYDAARMLASEPPFWPFLALLLLILLGCLTALAPRGVAVGRVAIGPASRAVLVGLIIACLGYAPYLASASHVLITQRTHLVSAIGGALAVAALLQAVTSRPKALSFACWTVVLSLALGAQWTQLDHYTRLSLRERMILSGIVQAAPDLGKDQHILIIDRSGQLESTWMMKGEILMSALSYLYNQHVNPVVCAEPGLVWADFAADSQARPGRCIEGASSWEIGVGVPGEHTLPKQDLITVVMNPDGVVRRRGAQSALPPTPAQIRRWRGILNCWPASACRYDAPRLASYHYDWGSWWSLEEAPWGGGWLDASWDPPSWRPRSYAWMNTARARLWVPLAPVPGPYELRVRFYQWISPTPKDSLSISVNGKALHIYQDKDMAVATVPATDLVAGLNDVTFSTNPDPNAGVTGAMDWIELKPASSNGLGHAGATEWTRSQPSPPAAQTLGSGAVISFADGGNAKAYSGAGWWSGPDGVWTWTDGADSDLKFTLRSSPSGYRLAFQLLPALSKGVPVRTVQVSANGRVLGNWTFSESSWANSVVHVPQELTGVPIILHLHQSATPSAKELGTGPDPRHVGLAVKVITVESGS